MFSSDSPSSHGLADSLRRTSRAVLLGVCFSLGLWLGWLAGHPVFGIALGYTLGMLLVVFPAYLGFALHGVGVPYRAWLAQLHPAAPATAAMALLVVTTRWLLIHVAGLSDVPLALLAIEVPVGAIGYAFFARRAIRWFIREGLRDLL